MSLVHVVMFQFNQGADRTALAKEATEKLLKLQSLECIEDMSIHADMGTSPYSNYDMMLVCRFNHFAQLEEYQLHPQHQEFVSWLKTVISARACVDYDTYD